MKKIKLPLFRFHSFLVKKHIIALYILFFLTTIPSLSCLYAQWYQPDKVDRKAMNVLDRSADLIQDGRYERAMMLINEAISLDNQFIDALISKAALFQRMKKYDSSVVYYQHAIQMDTLYGREQHLPYSISLAGMAQYKKALDAVNRYLSKPALNERGQKTGRARQAQYLFAIQYDSSYLRNINIKFPTPLNHNINSEKLEYYPSLPINGKKLIFNRRGSDGDEDFYESYFSDSGWTKAYPLRGAINTDWNEGAGTISQDGRHLIYTGCNYAEGFGSCDLYIAELEENGNWKQGKNLGPMINTDFWESSPCLSPDNKTLYFSGNQPGGYGGKDIWISHRLPSGKWGRPMNAGPTINTASDETCPFMHADNIHLYFSSNGHPGYGSMDIFVSERKNDTTWTTPFNLGYPVNTHEEEGSFIVAASGDSAFFTSDRYHYGRGLDIYSIQLREQLRPVRTVGLHGFITDASTSQPIICQVELIGIQSQKKYDSVVSNVQGQFFVTLSKGEDYLCTINSKNYLFYSQKFTVNDSIKDQYLQITLQPIQKNARIVLKHILFERNSFSLSGTRQPELEKLFTLMQENPNMQILIVGHTDNTGTSAFNLTLSKKRAEAVMQYLQSKGIEAHRMKAKGMGDQEPVDKNSSEEGKNNNRRTEIHVTQF